MTLGVNDHNHSPCIYIYIYIYIYICNNVCVYIYSSELFEGSVVRIQYNLLLG